MLVDIDRTGTLKYLHDVVVLAWRRLDNQD